LIINTLLSKKTIKKDYQKKTFIKGYQQVIIKKWLLNIKTEHE